MVAFAPSSYQTERAGTVATTTLTVTQKSFLLFFPVTNPEQHNRPLFVPPLPESYVTVKEEGNLVIFSV